LVYNFYSDETTAKLRFDSSDGPWGEAITCVNQFVSRINKKIDQWRVNTSQNIPYFLPVNDEVTFLDDFEKINYFLTHNFHETDSVAEHFKNYQEVLCKEAKEFIDNLLKLQIHVLIAAFKDKNGHMMVDLFKKRDEDSYRVRNVHEFMNFFCNKQFIGYYYKVQKYFIYYTKIFCN